MAFAWVAACGSSVTPDGDPAADLSDASSTKDANLSLDASSSSDATDTIDDSALDASCTPQATCSFSLVQQGAPVVSTYEAGPAPALMGGTIQDGTYVLTQQTYYEREAGGPVQTTTQTIRWACGSAVSVGVSNGYPESRSFTVVTNLTANAITEQVTNCTPADAGDAASAISFIEAPFEATSTTVKFYITATKVLLTYSKI